MEDFKTTAKMQCFKEGGSVQRKIDGYQKRDRKEVMSEDIAKDKSMVKKGVKQHEAHLHKGEPKTELTFKKGGRAKKEGGCVGRYKTGGKVENAYGSPKTDKDIKDIANTKRQKPKKMQAGGMAGMGAVSDAERASLAGSLNTLPGTMTGPGQISDLEKRRMMERKERAKKYLGPSQQRELEMQEAAAMRGQGAVSNQERGILGSLMGRKKGGKVKKCAEGGSLKETNAQENPGLAKLPTNVRNKMGYMSKGGKAKKMMAGGTCS
jgi:hypothetical protein